MPEVYKKIIQWKHRLDYHLEKGYSDCAGY
jgi:hypothetical protein